VTIEPFTVHIDESVLMDLRARIRNTRWPSDAPVPAWEQGTDLAYLQGLLDYWAGGFDWPARERDLNRYNHFRTVLDGVHIHFVHQKARGGNGIPLILTHGWPSTFLEMLPLVPMLTDPAAHGIDGPGFDVVIPSLPGYAFSERPPRTGVNYRYVADLWHRLMRALGYDRYGAAGGDFGAGVATLLALDDPSSVTGIYLTTFELDPYRGPAASPLSTVERAYLAVRDDWDARERGYSAIQSTKPQTLGYGLSDSPAGLAAWILEKWRSWTDCDGDLEARVPRDFLLTMLTIYWATNTITTSIRDYYDNRWTAVSIGPHDFVSVPTAFGVFTGQFVFEGDPPREYLARLYNIRRWTPMPRGGHFAAVEEPDLLAHDLTKAFATWETT
jgi:pimeloyl-ACP methyl ester carboxylesterase